MKKTYVLDTSAILNDPHILTALEDNTVVIPEVVLDELDGKKDKKDEIGYNSREATRILNSLIEQGKANGQSLLDGLPTPGGGILRVEINHTATSLPATWTNAPNDNRIIQVCKGTLDKEGKEGAPVIFITHDMLLKIKAESLGIECQVFEKEQASRLEDQYKGVLEVTVPTELLPNVYDPEAQLTVPLQLYKKYLSEVELSTNQFIIFKHMESPNVTSVAIWDGDHIKFFDQSFHQQSASGITPRNLSQKLMMYALKQPASEVPLVVFKGPAGTAKTLMALAVGLDQTQEFAGYHPRESKSYRKLLVCRTSTTMDEDLGYLPGGEQEKLAPYMRPIRDNLEVILQVKTKNSKDKEQLKKGETMKEKIDEYFNTEIINVEAVGFLRGRSITNQYIIIDEAQNATANQIKSIITRVGEGTKIILCGDPEQIDHPYLDERNNGLSVAAEMMKGSKLCMQVSLSEEDCVRSELAKEAIARFSSVK